MSNYNNKIKDEIGMYLLATCLFENISKLFLKEITNFNPDDDRFLTLEGKEYYTY